MLCECFFQHLRSESPDRKIDVLVAGHVPLFRHMPSVDRIILATPEIVLGSGWGGRAFRQLVAYLKAQGYQEAIELLSMVPKGSTFSAFTGLILKATDAPIRIGRRGAGKILWEYKGIRKAGETLLRPVGPNYRIISHEFDPLHPSVRSKHESLLSREALGFQYERAADQPRLEHVDGLAGIWADELIKRLRCGVKKVIVGVNIESTYDLKAWPLKRFLSVMHLARAEGANFVIVGLKHSHSSELFERELGDSVLDLSGRTGLEELLAVIERLDVFLSADTGPAHLAQAYGIPTLVLFGPSHEKEFGPVSDRHVAVVAERHCKALPCVLGPCLTGDSCMLNISERRVERELVSMIQKARNRNHPVGDIAVCTVKEVIDFK